MSKCQGVAELRIVRSTPAGQRPVDREEPSLTLRRDGAGRLLRAVLWRVAHRTRVSVSIATLDCSGSTPAPPAGFRLVRLSRTGTLLERAIVDKAMQGAGEPRDLPAPRFAHGDEFFGWQATNGDIVCFGWVTYRDRTVGPVRIPDAPRRAFLYNFHTLAPFRARGLYTKLLVSMKHALASDEVSQLVIDANVSNRASSSAIEKAGFSVAAEVSYYTFAMRWHYASVRPALKPPSP